MLGIDRHAARCTWTAALVLLVLWLLFQVRVTLFVFVLAILFAYLLWPVVKLLDRFLPTRTRAAALALAYVLFLGVSVTLAVEIGSVVASQAQRLAKELPQRIEEWKTETSPNPTGLERYKTAFIDAVQSEFPKRASDMIASAARAGGKVLTVASGVLYAIIIPILAFFFLKDGGGIRQHILDMVEDGPRRELLDDVLMDLDVLLAHYMRALVVLSLAAFTAYSIALSAMGVPYAILLAAIGGMLEIIPMLGPLAAAIAIILVAAISGSHILLVLIFLAAYRVIQDYFISPHLMGQGVEIHPLLVLFGVFAGAEIAGIPGTFLSVPVLALARLVYLRIRKSRLGAHAIQEPT